MEKITGDSEDEFIKKYKIEDIYKDAKNVDSNIWNNIKQIEEDYVNNRSQYYEAIVNNEVSELLKDEKGRDIHSIRYRIKKVDSLLLKIIKKKAHLSKAIQCENKIEKYRNLDENNYFKILTDIGGIRIIIRYREQWETVHRMIWQRYYRGNEFFVSDYVKDYRPSHSKPFIAEMPIAYYRNEQDKRFYEKIGRGIFDFQKSEEGYNSIHYIVNINGKYIEIQMRTIYDEAWSECTHDLVYKGIDKKQKAELKYLSKCLAQQTIAAESISNFLFEKVNKRGSIFEEALNDSYTDEEKQQRKNACVTRGKKIKERAKKIQSLRENEDLTQRDVQEGKNE